MPPSQVWLLGRQFGPFSEDEQDHRWGQQQRYLRAFQALLWFTYRSGFPPIQPTLHTSDTGWGCMLRSGQMLLGNTLLRLQLGDEWTPGFNNRSTVVKYSKIVRMFLDRDSDDCPFSIHRIAQAGEQFDKKIGSWFGPATIASVLKLLVSNHLSGELKVYVAQDGALYLDELNQTCMSSKESFTPLLILIPLRLGLDNINPIYESALRNTFTYPQSVGIAGGRPNASLYFVGSEDAQLVYLDPHITRPSPEMRHIEEYTEDDWHSFHCAEIRRIDIARIDPSLLLGFVCRNREQLDDFLSRAKETEPSLFSIIEKTPSFMNDSVLEHDDESSDDGELL